MDKSNYKYMDELFLDNYKSMDQRKIYNEDILKIKYIDNGIVLTARKTNEGGSRALAGVLDEQGRYVELSRFEALSEVDSWGGSYDIPDKKSIPYVDEEVIYMGRFWKHWGHFLMDLISRLWYVISPECGRRQAVMSDKIKIVYDSEVDISGGYLDVLKLLGISEEQLVRITEPTKFKKIIVPECSHKPGIAVNIWYRKMFDVMVKNALEQFTDHEKYKGKRIYFTRKMQGGFIPLEVGEGDIEALFEDNGFLVIAPEQYPVAEQIAMVNLAKEVACVAGTLPHNMVFAKQGAKLTIIRKTNKPNYRQVGIDEMRELNSVSVDAHISLKAVGASGPFIIDVNDNVKRYFEDNNLEFVDNKIIRWFKRKGKALWYIPIWIKRNYKKKPRVPLFDGTGFVNKDGAEKELFKYYIKKVW